MTSLFSELKAKSGLKKYSDELFYTDDNEFFIIYEGRIALRDDPGYSYEGIYKVQPNTARIIDDYCEKNNATVENLRDKLEDLLGFDDEEDLDEEEELDEQVEAFIEMCKLTDRSVEDTIRAAVMISQGCEADVWYMLFGDEYISIVDSVAEAGDVLYFEEQDPERDEQWKPIIENLDDYIFTDGEEL